MKLARLPLGSCSSCFLASAAGNALLPPSRISMSSDVPVTLFQRLGLYQTKPPLKERVPFGSNVMHTDGNSVPSLSQWVPAISNVLAAAGMDKAKAIANAERYRERGEFMAAEPSDIAEWTQATRAMVRACDA